MWAKAFHVVKKEIKMRAQSNKWLILILSIVTLLFGTETNALEIPNKCCSSVISQIATYVMTQIVDSARQKDVPSLEVAKRISNDPDMASFAVNLDKTRSLILLLEKDSIDKLTFTIVEPPKIIDANSNLEITVLVFFAINGKNLRSGMMTFQVIAPAENEEKITCGFRLGHVCFSTNEVVN
jgi:hypothetical protein